jgi:MFS family permease
LLVMAAGTLLYAFGFGMYGVVGLFALFLLAMAIITVGEMMVAPVGQAIVANLAPEDMRGRYMATYGFSWIIPATFGPTLAGMVLDGSRPELLWLAAGIIGVLATAGFYMMEKRVERARWMAVEERLRIMEQLEQGKLSAEQASHKLAQVNEGSWARLAPPSPVTGRRQLRIRVSDLVSGDMKVDLSLPMGVVNTVLYMGGQFSSALPGFETNGLRELVSRSAAQETFQRLDTNLERVEVSVERQGEAEKENKGNGKD